MNLTHWAIDTVFHDVKWDPDSVDAPRCLHPVNPIVEVGKLTDKEIDIYRTSVEDYKVISTKYKHPVEVGYSL
jgi:hypothetical protein